MSDSYFTLLKYEIGIFFETQLFGLSSFLFHHLNYLESNTFLKLSKYHWICQICFGIKIISNTPLSCKNRKSIPSLNAFDTIVCSCVCENNVSQTLSLANVMVLKN